MANGKLRIFLLRQAARRLAKDEKGGAISAFILILLVTMLVVGGMGIDFMRHESERLLFQDALDRGVLAAASYENEGRELDLKEVVRSYVTADATLQRRSPYVDVDPKIGTFNRRVTATGSYEVETFFLRLIGIDSLTINAASVAETSRGEVEISLVLDTTGSMRGDKFTDMQAAAVSFVNQLLTEETKPYTYINLIPFTAQVNAGATLAGYTEYFNLDTWHNYSYCFEMGLDDYKTTTMKRETSYKQEQHFYRGNYSKHECPHFPIVPFSNNAGTLETAIKAMSYGGYTATYAGMKWGTALLDPDAQALVTKMIADKKVDSALSGRPVAWDDADTTKVIVIMTDGDNTNHLRLKTSKYKRYGTDSWDEQANADYWNNNSNWDSDDDVTVTSGSTGNTYLKEICKAAKKKIPNTEKDRITVYSIGFDVDEDSTAYTLMRDCASHESKFYHVEKGGLTEAFNQIATSISKLQLVN